MGKILDRINRNDENWFAMLSELFEGDIPTTYEWVEREQIKNVLKFIGEHRASNHTMFPESGGLDIEGAKDSLETNCLELIFDGSTYIVKPDKLSFQHFEGEEYQWSYFYLECGQIEPTDVYDYDGTQDVMHEELCEIAPLEYVHRSAWDENMYGVEELSDEARLIVRMKGKFLIVPKKSFYNSVPETYDGRHHQMGRYGFKDHMESLMRMFNEEVKS